MSVHLFFWWAVLLLSSFTLTLKTLDPDRKDAILKKSVKDIDLLSRFYQAVEKALPELQELRSSFERMREQYNHFHTLDDMLANFGQSHDEEDLGEEEEQAWQESTKAWIRDIEENLAKNNVSVNISQLKVVANLTTTKEEPKKQEENSEESHEDIKVEKDSSSKKKGKEEDKLNDDPDAAATISNSTDTGNRDTRADPFDGQKRPKRSLEENPQEQPEQRVVAKRKAQMLDDFEDHNGNRASFGVLGNGMLTPDAEELGGKSLSFPGHELLAHYNDLEASHDYESLAHIYDPTRNMVPLINQQQQVPLQQPVPLQQQVPLQQPVQLQQQQPQQQQPQVKSSHFKASFNLNNIFNDLSKVNRQPAQPVQQPPLANPIPVQQPIQQYRFVPQAPSMGIHRYYGPYGNKQPKLNVDANCIPITMLPPNCTSPSPASGISNPTTPGPYPGTTNAPAPTSDTGDSCKNADSLKMNVAINANVCADPKTKLFSGNGSISVQPAPQMMYSEATQDKARLDERHIRDVNKGLDEEFSIHEWEPIKEEKKPRRVKAKGKVPAMKWARKNQPENSTRKPTPQKVTKMPEKCQKNTTKCDRLRPEKTEPRPSSFDKLISGKLSEEIVDAVFDAIACDPDMERLVPVLQRNRQRQKQPKDFYQIRTDNTENFLRQTEGMVRDTMQAISEIIDEQISRRACFPLRPDLVEFYDLILKTAEEEQIVREKRQSSLRVLSADFSEDVRLLDPGKISEKTKIVKKLLHQYQDLPLGDQLAAAKTHDELLLDLEYLRKMADTVERRKRSARMKEVVKEQTLDEVLEQRVNSEYSPRFIKLLKSADLFKESGETLAKDRI